jgi:hypothetical protein
MKIICIDLTMYNHQELTLLCKQLVIKSASVLKSKDEGFAKLYINTESVKIIAFTRKKSKDQIEMMDCFFENLQNLQPLEISKNEPSQVEDLTLDSILDKISKSGLISLSVSEKKFLDNFN